MGTDVEGLSFKCLSLDERVRALKDYVLSENEILMKDLLDNFGCGYYAMFSVINEAGFCLLPKSYHSANRVKKAYREVGRNVLKLRERTGFSYGTVCGYLKELGLSVKSRGRPRVDIKEREELILSGECNTFEIAKKEGVSKMMICSYIISRGLRDKYRDARKKNGFRIYGSG